MSVIIDKRGYFILQYGAITVFFIGTTGLTSGFYMYLTLENYVRIR